MTRLFPFACCSFVCLLTPLAAQPIISEFLSVNEEGLTDAEGQRVDWIELHNTGEAAVDLEGHVLADANDEWAFPASVTLGPDERMVVFASGRDAEAPAQDAAGNWHTSFRLGREEASLSLRAPSGEVLSVFENLPRQRADVSYGIASTGDAGFFEQPTPGTANGVVVLGYVGDTRFSVDRGYYEEPFSVTIEVEPEDAVILYTTDGTTPDKGTIFTGPVGEVYAGPIEITRTTVLKAMAYKNGWRSSDVDTQTYVFLQEVLRQPVEPPEGYPDEWGGQRADYGMDADVVEAPEYREAFDAAFRVFPTLSISMEVDDLFGRRGIYQNTTQEGPEWERPSTVEFLFPEAPGEGFHVPCGIRIQGGSSRQTDIPKHSFSVRFRREYGLGELAYPLFDEAPYGESAVDRFDLLQLRSGFNFAWTHRHYYQARHAQYNRDQFVNDLFLAMGNQGVHGRWFHCYLNGIYWGLYHLHERPDANYMASYFGGAKEDYDAVNSGQATDGNLQSWNAMWAAARQADDEDGMRVLEEHLDVDGFIDYMLLNFYVGNWDWDGHNWRAAGGSGTEQPGQWHFFPWDSEFAISPNGAGVINNPAPIENALTIDRTRVGGGANRPTGLHQTLLDSPFYKQRFADRIQKHFYGDGVLTPERVAAVWKRRSDEMDVAIVAESARWGDYKRDLVPGRWPASNYDLYTKNDHYLPNQRFLFERYFPERSAIVLEQLAAARLKGNDHAPVFLVDGSVQHGGVLSPGQALTFEGRGVIAYTLDGETDPMDAGALAYAAGTEVVLEGSATVRARAQSIFGQWSPLSEAFFAVGNRVAPGQVIVSELHYHPAAPSEAEREAGFEDRAQFEFLELQNVSEMRLNLIGVQAIDGVSFVFEDDRWLAPSEAVVLAHDPEAFLFRYPEAEAALAGRYSGRLRNSGERLEMVDAEGTPLLRFRYEDEAPWPEAADGAGYSLVWQGGAVISAEGQGEDPASEWRASDVLGGSPGRVHGGGGDDGERLDYTAWLSTVFTPEELARGEGTGPLDDHDGDGRVTAMEFAVGSSPRVADRGAVLELRLNENGAAELGWKERVGFPEEGWRLEVSEDLQTWLPLTAANGLGEREITPLSDIRREVWRRLPPMEGARYVRASVVLPAAQE